MRRKTSGSTCARPISQIACSKPIPQSSTRVRTHGVAFSTSSAASRPLPAATGPPQVNQSEVWYKVLLHAADRFWEKNTASWAALPKPIHRSVRYTILRIVSRFSDDSISTAKYGGTGLYTAYQSGRFRSNAARDAGGVLLGSYTWGPDARRMGALSQDRRKDITIVNIARFHPEIADVKVIDEHSSIFWDQTRWMRGGAYSYLEPARRFEMIREASKNEGNLYFAGEHCSSDNAWIQGAIS